jgi:hypothetical protein
VPQGSVLGPLLFLLYINDLPSLVTSQVRLFADDTAIYLTVTSEADCQSLQDDLSKLEKWEELWDMEFNPGKCQVLHVTRNRKPIAHQYKLHGQILSPVKDAKYLGVDICHDLSWNTHISRITTNANKTLGLLKRNIKTKHEKVKSLSYQTLVRPQLEYASPVWSPHTQVNKHNIEMIQRRAVRWVKNDYSHYTSVTQLQNTLNWRTLENRRIDAKLVLFYKVYHHLVAISLPSYLEAPTRLNRHMHPLSLRQVHTGYDYFKYSFFPHTTVLWNRLPHPVAMLPDLESFKQAVAQLSH